MNVSLVAITILIALAVPAAAQQLPGTAPLTMQGDLAAQMVDSIDRYLMHATQVAASNRERFWHRDTSSPEAYVRSVEPNRQHLRKILGLVDDRVPPQMIVDTPAGAKEMALAKGAGYKVYAVRWPVLRGVQGEGLLLVPDKPAVADVIALGDCDWTPEQLVGLAPGVPAESQFARRLGEAGCRVLVPVLIDRQDTFTGTSLIRPTNLPDREFIQRAAYEVARTMPGYEVQKVLAAVDFFSHGDAKAQRRRIGVIGYGEGGLIAFYSAAVDTRIDACCVSGYFGPREALWSEPIYRNLYGLLPELGDAQIAELIAPRRFLVCNAPVPDVSGPPRAAGLSGAAPGALRTMTDVEVESELRRTHPLSPLEPGILRTSHIIHPDVAEVWVKDLAVRSSTAVRRPSPPISLRKQADVLQRLRRQFEQIVEHTQRLMRESPARRTEFWAKADASSPEKWSASTKAYREQYWDDLIGRLPAATIPLNARSRLLYETDKFRAYEVVLDVFPNAERPTPNADGVFAYGVLLLPKDLKPGERRPVVVCQHGLEGRPTDVADIKVNNPAYNQYACRLAERGFITFAPQNPYIGGDRFRVLLRKAQPLGLTLFSFIIRQHERMLDWLSAQPFVDPQRIAFYGLSYGGKSAMRIPACLPLEPGSGKPGYCLSICSADYNEWVWKNMDAHSPYSYLFTNEYDMPEWNLANTFNYAEMSWLICPRPFMVERGHQDGVAPDEWVAYEFAKTRRRYDQLGLGDRTELEVFNGPHTIHGVGTFDFLHKHLNWPKP